MPQIGEIKSDSKSRKSIYLSCEKCGKERWVRLENNKPRNRFCKECFIKQLINLPHLGAKGNKNAWKGGQVRHSEGYILIHQPDHPRASQLGYVSRARLVLEGKLGRCLWPNAVVHHINGVRDDDRPENLMELFRDEHTRLHKNERSKQAVFEAMGEVVP